jgi:predicted small secreted protein
MNKTLRTLATAGLLLAALTLSACNTLEGAGKDLQAGGKATSEAARKVGDSISGQK